MTKREFEIFALKRGYEARYSGKLRKSFIKKLDYAFRIDIHALICEKAPAYMSPGNPSRIRYNLSITKSDISAVINTLAA